MRRRPSPESCRENSPSATRACSRRRSGSMADQLVFAKILAVADEQRRAALDRLPDRVQTWFDELPDADKDQLAEWMTTFEWDTCVALSAAAGDWQTTKGGRTCAPHVHV